MVKVPDRFLGFSFSVGDVLLELDNALIIQNADGAISEITSSSTPLIQISFLDLLSKKDAGLFEKISSSLKSSNRIGPVQFEIGSSPQNRKKFALFINKLPHQDNRIFLVLMAPYRLGIDAINQDSMDKPDEKERIEQLFSKVDKILDDNKGHEKNLNITLLDAGSDTPPNDERLNDLDQLLKKYSAGGNTAERLGNNRYAIVHENGPEGIPTEDLIRQLTKSTGLKLKGMSIDADKNILSEADGVRALIFSLQQFSENCEGYDIETLATGYDEIVEKTANKVQKFRNILKEGAFSLVFQPIVSLKTNIIHHSEALARFDSPDMIDLQFETICFAEQVGLIQEFDKAVFKRAADKIEKILEHDIPPNVAINLSGKSLSNQKFLDDLMVMLQGYIHLKDYISLEITESSEIKNLAQLRQVIDKIRSMKFRVYLDDFGSGASGFRYLKELMVDGVKIDGEYVRDALVNKKTKTFLKSMVMLCLDLGIETIGEWVETKEQADFLISLGVNYAQGYLFGRPSSGLLREPCPT